MRVPVYNIVCVVWRPLAFGCYTPADCRFGSIFFFNLLVFANFMALAGLVQQ